MCAHVPTGSAPSLSTSAPRLLVVLEEGAVAEVVEDFGPTDDATQYFCNAVAEMCIGEGAVLTHSYVQLQAREAYHMKTTVVNQVRVK